MDDRRRRTAPGRRGGRNRGRWRPPARSGATGSGRTRGTTARPATPRSGSHGGDAVAAVEDLALLGPRHRKAGNEFVTQLIRIDDRVDDQLGGQPEQVDVLLVLTAAVGDV